MSKTHFLESKETTLGLLLFSGVFLLLIINIYIVVTSLVFAYGAKKNVSTNRTIDDTTLSKAIEVIELKE